MVIVTGSQRFVMRPDHGPRVAVPDQWHLPRVATEPVACHPRKLPGIRLVRVPQFDDIPENRSATDEPQKKPDWPSKPAAHESNSVE